MNTWLIVVGLLLGILSTGGFAQGTQPTIQCPLIRLSSTLDSPALKRAHDSIAREMSGRWQLIQMAGGWGAPHQPLQKIDMTLDQHGQGLIYQDGRVRSRYQLTLSNWYGWVRTTINEPGEKPFLTFAPRQRGFLQFCEQTLILDQNAGDGDIYVFKRTTPDRAPNTGLDTLLMKEGIMQTCRPLAFVADPVALQASLDSIGRLMRGRWLLRIIEGGWTPARKPDKEVELVLDGQGGGLIYEDGQSVASIKLFTRRLWGMVRFDVDQQGKSIINLSTPKPRGGLLSVCEDKLFITDEQTVYAFRRIQ